MNWEQDGLAIPQPQPPTPTATPKSAKASSFEAASYETPRAGVATFESFFPFSTSPLEQLGDAHIADPTQQGTPAAGGGWAVDQHNTAVEGSLNAAMPVALSMAPNPAEAPRPRLSSPRAFDSTWMPGQLTKTAEEPDRDHSGESMQTPPPTVSSATISPTVETGKRRARVPRRLASPVEDQLTSEDRQSSRHLQNSRARAVSSSTRRRRRLHHSRFSPEVGGIGGGIATVPTTAPSYPSQPVFWGADVDTAINMTDLQGPGMPGFDVIGGDRPVEGSVLSKEQLQYTLDLGRQSARRGQLSFSDAHLEDDDQLPPLPGHSRLGQRSVTDVVPGHGQGVVDPNELHSSSWTLLSHGSSQENSPMRARYPPDQLRRERSRPSEILSVKKGRKTLKPRSNNGAVNSLYGEVPVQRPNLKRRFTDDPRGQSHSRTLDLNCSFYEPEDVVSDQPYLDSSQRLRQPSITGRRESSSRGMAADAGVSFVIDDSGRARAERTSVSHERGIDSQSARDWDAENEPPTDSDDGTDDDGDFAISRNTSFAVPDRPRDGSSRRGRRGETGSGSTRRVPSGLGIENVDPRTSHAGLHAAFVGTSETSRASRKSRRHAYSSMATSTNDLDRVDETHSEAETVMDDPVDLNISFQEPLDGRNQALDEAVLADPSIIRCLARSSKRELTPCTIAIKEESSSEQSNAMYLQGYCPS
ncbi:MAG: hypothetical protein M1823_005632 [Watsoniomyces obsoletus]|nr:MAG: hypothetical protein M1823_005632 [Watsoniomyces obsoletus]